MADLAYTPKPKLPSLLQPHHLTHVYYPCPEPICFQEKHCFMVEPYAAAGRYEPLPLIQDPAVEAVTSLHEAYETSFYSATLTRKSGNNLIGSSGLYSSRSKASFKYLLADMAKVTDAVGETELRVLTFIDELSPGDSKAKIWIACRTTHIKKRRDPVVSTSSYEGDLDEFLAIVSPLQWLKDIQDLVLMRSDRAWKHVCFRLRRGDFRGLTTRLVIERRRIKFKAPRPVLYDGHVELVTTPAKLEEIEVDERTCVICTDTFDEEPTGEHIPVVLPCEQRGKAHIIGKSCLTLWCQSQGPKKAQCPHCRHPVFSNPAVAKSLTFGTALWQPKNYVYDTRYTAYENFERSCADLDKNLASLDSTKIDFDESVLGIRVMDIFDFFLDPPREPAESTPFHLQPQLRPEIQVFRAGIVDFLRDNSGQTLHMKQAEEYIHDSCMGDYDEKIIDLGLNARMTNLELYRSGESLAGLLIGHKKNEEDPDIFWMPMGLREFFMKAVNRSLKFLTERRCGDECSHGKEGLHYHGERLYYKLSDVVEMADWLEASIGRLQI